MQLQVLSGSAVACRLFDIAEGVDLDVLDVANAQFLEMRYYDQLLDEELPRMYDLVEAMQRSRPLLSSRRFADLARRLYGLVAEVTEVVKIRRASN